ncbi:ArsR family transcriptional regulator [Halorubrum sp. BOL3-1]|uniref:ArsR/SmtB family transcription factor n=1 Tax=Halorubrum sp. BOL3-1 TaxID=2497325 RepID=UPI001004E003|nr:winged helix-turn-helix domain-containing protein [Halorubrum sp. BOL3-1]QAU14106.1 ArsR family transcriptional regulator [Halorubrum sp. BOL3-1]
MVEGDSSRGEIYRALTDETRIQILLVLADQYDEAWSSGWLTFSELRERVGVEDTSRFSYHLNELQDEFVVKIEGRYRPRVAALEIASAIRAGTYDEESVAVDRQQTDYDCPHCEQTLVASYRDHSLHVGCPDHGAAVAFPTPPRALSGRTLSEVIDLSLRKHASDVRLLRDGVCPRCWGSATISFPRESVPESYLVDDVAYGTAKCDDCWLSYPIPIARVALGHPALETLYAEHELGPADAQIGPHDLARVSDVDYLNGTTTAVRLTIRIDDDTLILNLNESCSIRNYQRK